MSKPRKAPENGIEPLCHHTLRGLYLGRRNQFKHTNVALKTGRASEDALGRLVLAGYLNLVAGYYFFSKAGLDYCAQHFTSTPDAK